MGATAASYCPSRAGELPKHHMTKSHEQWDGKLCITLFSVITLIHRHLYSNEIKYRVIHHLLDLGNPVLNLVYVITN